MRNASRDGTRSSRHWRANPVDRPYAPSALCHHNDGCHVNFRDDFPLPDTDWPPTAPFWAAAARHTIQIPRCDNCAGYVWYPEGPCRRCGSEARIWTAVSGRGSLFSWSVVHRAFIPQFAADVPFVTALVALDEDPSVRLATRIVDAAIDTLRADMPVRAVFRALTVPGRERQVVAPLFTPAPPTDGQRNA